MHLLQNQLERCAEFLSVCPCPKKRAFPSMAKARKRAREIGGLLAYECVCGKFHMTTKVPERFDDYEEFPDGSGF